MHIFNKNPDNKKSTILVYPVFASGAFPIGPNSLYCPTAPYAAAGVRSAGRGDMMRGGTEPTAAGIRSILGHPQSGGKQPFSANRPSGAATPEWRSPSVSYVSLRRAVFVGTIVSAPPAV